MFEMFARRYLRRMSTRYDYDVSYMEAMLDRSPRGFWRLSKLFALARHRESAPVEAAIAVKLVGAMAEDCGPCTQLVVNFAREARVPAEQVQAVLQRDAQSMSPNVALAVRFAEAVVYRLSNEDETREAVRAQWGDKGVIDLALALQVGRLFPMLKAALGYAKECQRVEVGGRMIDVVKRAA